MRAQIVSPLLLRGVDIRQVVNREIERVDERLREPLEKIASWYANVPNLDESSFEFNLKKFTSIAEEVQYFAQHQEEKDRTIEIREKISSLYLDKWNTSADSFSDVRSTPDLSRDISADLNEILYNRKGTFQEEWRKGVLEFMSISPAQLDDFGRIDPASENVSHNAVVDESGQALQGVANVGGIARTLATGAQLFTNREIAINECLKRDLMKDARIISTMRDHTVANNSTEPRFPGVSDSHLVQLFLGNHLIDAENNECVYSVERLKDRLGIQYDKGLFLYSAEERDNFTGWLAEKNKNLEDLNQENMGEIFEREAVDVNPKLSDVFEDQVNG